MGQPETETHSRPNREISAKLAGKNRKKHPAGNYILNIFSMICKWKKIVINFAPNTVREPRRLGEAQAEGA